MKHPLLGLLVLGAGAWLLYNRRDVAGVAESVGETVTEAFTGWKGVHEGPRWVPLLNAAEVRYGLPQDVLARIAYQESRFRPEIVDGSLASPAGALGLMQLMPQFFNTVLAPRPFTPADTAAQIDQAGQLLSSLYRHFGDWTLAVAAYNDGRGNIDEFVAGRRDLPAETSKYVVQVTADVPLPGVLSA